MINNLGVEFFKIAKLKTELQDHQKRVVEKIKEQPGLILAHGLGSGKTLSSIAMQDALNLPATVIVPAALKENYLKEINKHLKNPKESKIDIESLQNIARKGQIESNNPILIVDEAHRLREPNSKGLKAVKKNLATKRILLTGSPFYNHPSDISSLINIAADNEILPSSKKDFEKEYIKEEKISPSLIDSIFRNIKPGIKQIVNPSNKENLKTILNKWVDYHKSSTKDFPISKEEIHKIPMTEEQLKIYDSILDKAPPWVSLKVKANLPPNKQESKQLNAYLSAARQISNTDEQFKTKGEPQSPKINEAYKKFKEELQKNPKTKALVYSNFLSAGIEPYKKLLLKDKIPYGEFTGEMKQKERDKLVKDYNENKLNALLLSSAGGEGLDTKKTNIIQILDPHWNEEKIKQVIGRGVRYKSHEGLKPEEQKVNIQRFLAIRPRSSILEKLKLKEPGGSTDEYLYNRSKEKEELNNKFLELFKNHFEKTAEVKSTQQSTLYTCGPTCLKAVLSHYGKEYKEKYLEELVGAKPNRGCEVDEITLAAKKLGFNAFDRALTLEECKSYLAKDIPIIADVQSWNYREKEHYVVIYKYENDKWYIMDPNVKGNQRILSTEELEDRWWGRRMDNGKVVKKWGCIITI
jgi:superfamily II DNA or RNA helicase